jgi:homoserine kinase type II
MGIKQTITRDELPLQYKAYNLIETKDGTTHSVYLLDDKYVLKIVHKDEFEVLVNEQKLLAKLENLLVPKLLDIVEKEHYIFAFYTQVKGESKSEPTLEHIKQIALFLKEFHSLSQHINSLNVCIFRKEYFNNLILQTKEKNFLKYFHSIDCELKTDGIIHGDLFCDNVKFYDEKLSGVYDFIEACQGDFIFELAVVSISWCFEKNMLDKEKVAVLLENYDLKISLEVFKEYIKYALLYYITTRYLSKKNYQELLNKLEQL